MTRIEWVDHPLRKNGFTPFHAEPGQPRGSTALPSTSARLCL
jgi:hypothetical protein